MFLLVMGIDVATHDHEHQYTIIPTGYPGRSGHPAMGHQEKGATHWVQRMQLLYPSKCSGCFTSFSGRFLLMMMMMMTMTMTMPMSVFSGYMVDSFMQISDLFVSWRLNAAEGTQCEPSKTVNPLNWRPGCFPWNLKKNIARRKGRKEQPGQPVLRTSRV